MRRLIGEWKHSGLSVIRIFTLLTLLLVLIAQFGGELLEVDVLGFEVLYPFMVAIAVGEWGNTRSDSNFDLIAAQSRKLFGWLFVRFAAVFIPGSLFAFGNMAAISILREGVAFWDMVLLYTAPAFFLSSLCALCGICFSREHMGALVVGIFWIVSMLIRSLLRIPGVQYVYLFICYAGDVNGVWLLNKAVLFMLGAGLWAIIYIVCKTRVFSR